MKLYWKITYLTMKILLCDITVKMAASDDGDEFCAMSRVNHTVTETKRRKQLMKWLISLHSVQTQWAKNYVTARTQLFRLIKPLPIGSMIGVVEMPRMTIFVEIPEYLKKVRLGAIEKILRMMRNSPKTSKLSFSVRFTTTVAKKYKFI